MLGNCLWGVYQMIGKLNPRVYLLPADPPTPGPRSHDDAWQASSPGTRTGQYARRHSPGQRNHRPLRGEQCLNAVPEDGVVVSYQYAQLVHWCSPAV